MEKSIYQGIQLVINKVFNWLLVIDSQSVPKIE